MVRPALIAALCLGLAGPSGPASACGPDSDCGIGVRSYRLYLPPAAARGPVGVLLFAHGYRGRAANEMANAGLRALADDLGLALVALQADGPDWALAHTPQAPDRAAEAETGYVEAVLADVARRTRIDPGRIVASGFSAGGMLTWTLACTMGGRLAGFVPLSGTFWAPVPDGCAAPPANLVHIQGTADRTVPPQGRTIGPARQGDVAMALAMYARHGGFRPGPTVAAPGGMSCTTAANPAGRILQYCTFAGGHAFSAERLRHGIVAVLAAR
jgi:polyhydroxybutyrate depolymerase